MLTGSFFAGGFDCDESGEQRCFGAFLIYCAAADDDFAHGGLVDQSRFERW